jgi:hypothetical protein
MLIEPQQDEAYAFKYNIDKGNSKINELRTILQRESKNS